MQLKFAVWGSGLRGRAIMDVIGKERVAVIVDSDRKLVGNKIDDILIVSEEEFVTEFRECPLIITPLDYKDIVVYIEKCGINSYFILNEECSELMGYGCKDVISQLANTFSISQCIYFYGINLLGLLLGEELENRGCNEVYMVPSKSNTEKFVESIKEIMVASHVKYVEEVEQEQADKIIITLSKDRDFYNKYSANGKYEQIYDLSYRIKKYYNAKIEQLKQVHKGKRCFIVATGSSLKGEDLEKLREENEISISMNRVYSFFENTRWRPQYYVFIDRGGIKNYEEDIKRLDLKTMIIGDGYEEFWEDFNNENMYKIHVTHTNSDSNVLDFSEQCEQAVYGGATVTYCCIQLAVYMGFDTIYLLGVDCDYKQGGSSQYFTSNYVKQGVKSGRYDLEENLAAYKMAREYAEKHNIKIYNATRGGKLEVFERVNFDEIFMREGDDE